MEGLFLLGFLLVQMKLYYKASLLRLLVELSQHRKEKRDILSEDKVEPQWEWITLPST